MRATHSIRWGLILSLFAGIACSSSSNDDHAAGGSSTVTGAGGTATASNATSTALGATTSGSTTTNATGAGGSSTCVDDDGSSAASDGSPQYPDLLSTYPRSIHELGCLVAGVDYHVGLPASQVLSDPAVSTLPNGCAYASNAVVCTNTATITIQGFDFSLHNGIQLRFEGTRTGMTTITKNNFGQASNCDDPAILDQGSGGTITITYNTIDGGGATCANPTFGGVIQAGDVIQWNWIKNSPEDMIRSGTDIRFNLMDTQGWSGHPDGIQYCGFSGSPVISHNTYRNPDVGQPAAGGTQPLHVESQCGTSVITNTVVSYNTVITPGTSGGQTANYDIACKQDVGTNTGFKGYGNYIDPSGAYGALIDSYNCQNTSWGTPNPNVNMMTGMDLPVP